MNHTEEMKMLTAFQKIQKNTERIAIALERLACYKQQEFVSAQAEAVHHDCIDCEHTDCGAMDEPCHSCYLCNKWEAKK